jgi:hypothetical protein
MEILADLDTFIMTEIAGRVYRPKSETERPPSPLGWYERNLARTAPQNPYFQVCVAARFSPMLLFYRL